jgi:hypothetical protein
MTSVLDKVTRVLNSIEGKINDELCLTPSQYCQLELYNSNQSQTKPTDFDCDNKDKFFYIVDIASTQTIGTLSCSKDDNDHYWLMFTSSKVKNPSIQATYFNSLLFDVEDESDSNFKVQVGDSSYFLNKTTNILSKVKIITPPNFVAFMFMMTTMTAGYWLSFGYVGMNYLFLSVPAIILFIFCVSIFGHDEYDYY